MYDGSCFLQKEQHRQDLEEEKLARDKAKKETLLHETRFGAKPSTPAKLRAPRKMPPNPNPRSLIKSKTSCLAQKVPSAVANLKSPSAAAGLQPAYSIKRSGQLQV